MASDVFMVSFDAFTTETSTSHRAIHPRLIRLGGTPTARFIEMVLRPNTPNGGEAASDELHGNPSRPN